jgi:hypothetical protein
MTEQRKIDGRTKRAADIALAKRQISPASYRALVEEGTITLQEAKELGRDRGPNTPEDRRGSGQPSEGQERASAENHQDTLPAPVSRISKGDTRQECWCGCGSWTSPGKRWKVGHDQRAKGIIKRAVREGKVDELDARLKEYGAERGLI